MECDDILSKDLSDKLPPMHNIQHVIDLTPGASLSDLPQHGMDLIMHIEIKWQVNELSLEVKQK